MPLILGIDPGSRVTGYAAVQQHGRELSVVKSGVVRLAATLDLSARLATLHQGIAEIISTCRPTVVAVEDVFCHLNVRSALALGHARGVVLSAAALAELPVASYPPATVKRAVSGHGRADKIQIQRMVQVLLSLEHSPLEDEADAMAVAICHAMIDRASTVARSAGAMRAGSRR